MNDYCIGRQPIYDNARTIVGWELSLVRKPGGSSTSALSGCGISNALQQAVVDIGLDRVLGQEPVLLKFCPGFESAPVLPPDRCSLVLDSNNDGASLTDALDRFRPLGYPVVLDNFEPTPASIDIARRAGIVRMQASAALTLTPSDVKALRAENIKPMVWGLSSETELSACAAIGFEMFQGHYLRRPERVSGRAIRVAQLGVLSLAGECRKEHADIAKITKIISADATFSYKLLQFASSALFGSRTTIRSIPQAISIVGLDTLARWCTLLMLSSIPNCPRSYVPRAVERGRMCEMLAKQTNAADTDSAYMTGLLSILDSVLGVPLEDLSPQLPVANEVKDALVERSGDLGRLLEAVLSFESGGAQAEHGFPLPMLEERFWEAVTYAKTTMVP